MVDTALLIAEAALLRKESRGGHFRADFPEGQAEVAAPAHRMVNERSRWK